MDNISEQRNKVYFQEAVSAIQTTMQDNAWQTHTYIQEQVIASNSHLRTNPHIKSRDLLIAGLVALVRSGIVKVLASPASLNEPFYESEVDPQSIGDFARLDKLTQLNYVMELCWVQALKDSGDYIVTRDRAIEILGWTHFQKINLFRVIDPTQLRVYYKLLNDDSHREKDNTPRVLATID